MSTATGSAATAPDAARQHVTTKINVLAVVALVLAVLGVGQSFGFGAISLTIFAVGAGHVALQQIRERGERGVWLARAALVLCYLVAAWALLTQLRLFLELGVR